MGIGLKKLSEFEGQGHITSVLRASIIKKTPLTHISISGDESLAWQIYQSYKQSVCCDEPVRGDACGVCNGCSLAVWSNSVTMSLNPQDGYVSFQINKSTGVPLDADVLCLFVYAFQSTKADVLTAARTLAKTILYKEYLTKMTDVLLSILYIKHNLSIEEIDKLEAIRTLAVRVSAFKVTACLRVLWDSQSHSVLSDASSIEMVSLLLSETLQPTPEPMSWNVMSADSETPIVVIEDDNLEQPLDLARMMEIARQ